MIPSIKTLEKEYTLKLFGFLLIWAFLGILIFAYLAYVTDISDDHILKWISFRLDNFLIIYIATGFCFITYFYWKKIWSYLSATANAIDIVYTRNSEDIVLPKDLYEVEKEMAQINQSLTASEKRIALEESRKNELIMCLAHDIRTPLTTVIGYLDLLKETTGLTREQQEKYIGIALNKSERLESLINELFDLTSYNTRAVSLHKSDVDLSTLISQIADELYPVISANSNEIKLSLDDSLMISVDPEKIARAFSNILTNAASYSDRNSDIVISSKEEGLYAVVRFQNSADTLSPQELQRMFDMFCRLDTSRTSATGGTGLGLTIAREIIELHGGEIAAESKDHTVSIVVRIPLIS